MSITSASMRKAHQEGEHQGRHGEVEDLQGYVSEALKAIIGLLMTKQRGLLMAGFRVAGAAPERPT
jgi:hypothetical protein